MRFLAIDVGSSSVKAQLFSGGVAVGELSRVPYHTNHDGVKVEIRADVLLAAVASAIGQLGQGARSIDLIGLSVMSPAWVAMDKSGQAITPLVSHQDRRSIDLARDIEHRVGKEKHLQLAGNRPFPGGISSTTFAWFLANQPEVMAKADLVGHLNTLLHRRMTGARVIDPSNASFTGLYLTCTQDGWSDELCKAVGVARNLLPQIVEADEIAGRISSEAAGQFGLTAGTPMLAGMVDTSAAMLLSGAAPGQLFHMCGSTDVLAVAAEKPRPHERLLTRALGVGKKWMSVATLAASGSALDWMRNQFFRDLSDDDFHALLTQLAKSAQSPSAQFEPYLAGERTSVEQKQAAFTGLTLASTREEMLAAVMHALAVASGRRLELLAQVQPKFLNRVLVSGGAGTLADLMHRDWPGHWQFEHVTEAGLLGLATIKPREHQ